MNDIEIDKIRNEAQRVMELLKADGLNIGEAYCVAVWIKSAVTKAQPEIRKLNPAIRKAQEQYFGTDVE
jgi:hypothetical protein